MTSLSPEKTRFGAILGALPRGQRLTESEFAQRHRVLVFLLVAQAPIVVVVAALAGHLHHPMLWVLLAGVAVLAVAGLRLKSQQWRATLMGVAMLATCSMLLHVGNGSTHLHIWFYVVFAAVSLYQMWVPFLVAVVFVAVHHLGMSVLSPEMVFSDSAAQQNPLPYALLHAVFLLAEAAALAYGWRFTEDAQRARRAEQARNAEAVERQLAAQEQLAEERERSAAEAQRLLTEQQTRAQRASGSIDRLHGIDSRLREDIDAVLVALDGLTTSSNDIVTASEQAGVLVEAAGQRSASITDVITRLRETLAEVDGIASTIERVAEQTNLLALNATIEAARAGEMGKGFAVVAGEVKDLAGETTKATEEIRRVIESVHADVGDVASAVESFGDVILEVVASQATIASSVEEQRRTASTGRAAAHDVSAQAGAMSGEIDQLVAAN